MTSTSAQLPLPPEVERVPFSTSCIRQVKNLVSKENTSTSLASIGADKVASHINATATQAFDIETRRDSSVKESDGGDTDLGYGDNRRASVLPDEEDEERRMSELQRVTWSPQPQLRVMVYNPHRLSTQARLSVKTQLTPKKTRW